jgi:von Willebrand factor type A domain
MTKHRLQLFFFVLGVTAIAAATGALVASASDTQGSVSPSRTLSTNDIVCDGTIDVTVTLDGTPGTAGTKSQVLLVLDQSGSVSSTLATSKSVAKSIIDGIDLTRNKVGIVAFAGTAVVKATPASANDGGKALKEIVDSLPNTPPGTSGSNHADAFLKAQAAFASSDKRVIVMITDGRTTQGNIRNVNDVTEANNAAQAARTAGTAVFTVRLGSSSTAIDSRLKGWASDPDTTYFQVASPSPATAIVTAINPEKQTPAATNAKVVDVLNTDFDFVSSSAGTYDSGTRTLTWNSGTLFDSPAVLTYTVKHNKAVVGVATKKISASVNYSSDQEGAIALANPDVFVRPCGQIIEPPKVCGGANPPCTQATTDPSKLEGTGQAGLAIDAGAPTGDSTLFLTKLDPLSFSPKACPGFTNRFVQLDVLPLTDKLVVSVDLPAPTGGPLLNLAKICLGTNLPFVTMSLGLAQQESDGLYYGLLPYGPRLTKINGTWVRSPFISLVESRNIITVRGSERVTHVVFEVQSVGITGSDGRPGYDPRWGG